MITTDSEINIPGTKNCDFSNIVYLLKCNKCMYGNYVSETKKNSAKNELSQKSILDSHKGIPVAKHYDQAKHFINSPSCVILDGNITTTADRQFYEQKLIHKFETYKCGLNRDMGFLSKYTFFRQSLHFSLYLGSMHLYSLLPPLDNDE